MIPNVKRAMRLAGMRPVPRWPARTSVDLRGKRILDELVKEVGPVDILINNAARSIRRPLAESLERW